MSTAPKYNLIYNASVMTAQGLGYTIGIDKLVDVSEGSELCFRPLEPPLKSELRVVWKKNVVMSKAARAFLEELKKLLG